jgi:CubicO group peptidase (beta-lactamase class C family)
VHRLASVSKSMSSLLVGVAVDRGTIAGADAPLLDFFGDLRRSDDPRWRAETLHHLLSMSMGLDWEPGDGPHGTGPAFFQQVLDRRVIHDPGTHWAYHSANVNLLAGVLKQATGLHADEFAEAHLFAPLGITAYDWSYLATDGYRLMDGSLQLRPRDMAKLGLLLRDGGRWRGEQVVSAEWIRRSITPHIDTDGPERYGYLWWLGEVPGQGGPQPVVFANGHGSQFIAWLPERDLILVVTGGNEDNGKHFAVMGVLQGVL